MAHITRIPDGAFLPTFSNLGVQTVDPKDVDAHKIAQDWLASFSSAVSASDIPAILATLHDQPWWKDLFALTWDLRTFFGQENIKQFLSDRLPQVKLSIGSLVNAQWQQPWPDLGWVCAQFQFETEIANGYAVARLVPTPQGWRSLILGFNLEGLQDFPEKIGELRDPYPSHGKWLEKRKKEQEFADSDPEVIIVGGGQGGLDVAARLRQLGTTHLLVEKNPRIGDLWRNRYEALCLHDPVWLTHMPYLPFPVNWPVYAPSQKVANWLEFFAEAMELNVWTSSTVTSATKNPDTGKWDVTVKRVDGTERIFHVDHVVFALGLGAGKPNLPEYPGREEYQGQVLHSTQHKSWKGHAGKKVFVVGACVSAHDIASDYADHGIDVTIFQRSSTYIMSTKNGAPILYKPNYWEGGPPTETADRIENTMPILLAKLFAQRQTVELAEKDKDILDGLRSVGYKLNDGEEGSGFLFLALKRAGGYYLDVGACQKIIDGKIKLKSGSEIERYTPKGLKFTDGSEIEADIILYATGFDDPRKPLLDILGPGYEGKLTPIWGLNDDGDQRTAWRELGPEVENAWYMMGNFASCRFFSKHLALQIKAKQEGKFGTRYSAPTRW
ncbi:FAD/NAD(P)-binding domain-containing protein [Irpex rosettiformis]|uniref:FAD/NAD(P)-binding domain-containing protein n=1 Tax=Irpex rosettiformis TaxID=378272 RepID=A0ACB8U654_9APHY|nr:FAD/NAD(P)-binding domain-containing protein [Irpex rosettiformis]